LRHQAQALIGVDDDVAARLGCADIARVVGDRAQIATPSRFAAPVVARATLFGQYGTEAYGGTGAAAVRRPAIERRHGTGIRQAFTPPSG
jgi:hypothetical protein